MASVSLNLDIWEKSYSTGNNSSDIGWSLSVTSSNAHNGYDNQCPYVVKYNNSSGGTVASGNKGFSNNTTTQLASGTINNYKHNSDGTASITLYAHYTTGVSPATASITKTIKLTTIPRYAQFTKHAIKSVSEDWVMVELDVDSNCDAYQYSLNGGEWKPASWGTYSVSGLSPNTNYNIKTRIRRQESQLWTESDYLNFTTYDFPKPTSINDFTIGDGASVNIYNPLGRIYTVDIISNVSNGVIGSYTGDYAGVVNNEFKTDDAISKQYASIPNSKSGTYYARVTYGSSVKTLGTGTYSIKGTETPTVGSVSYKDNNPTTIAITENNQKIIRNQSDLLFNIVDAKAVNGAYISKYEAIIGEKIKTSTSALNLDFGTVNSSKNTIAKIIVTDSRGLTATIEKEILIIDYHEPKTNLFVVERKEEDKKIAKVTIDAVISEIEQKNDKKFTLKYKQQKKEEYTIIELDNTNYNLNISFELNKIAEEANYNFILEMEDSLSQTTSVVLLLLNLEKTNYSSFENPSEKEIELLIYNTNFEKIGAITDAESIIWHKKYNDIGEFEIYLPVSSKNKELLQEDFYVVREDDESVGIIENFYYSYDEGNETDMMSVSGRFAESLLERRIIWRQTQIDGYVEQCVRNLLIDNVINPIIKERKIDCIKLGSLKGFTEKIKSQYTGDNLSTAIHDICNSNEIGYRLLFGDNNFYFELYKGIDSSYNQIENPHIIFSDEYDNLISSKFESNKSKYKNTALVAGEGEGLERTTISLNNNNSGINRRELFVDAKDLSTNSGEIESSEYNNMLQARGEEKLSEVQYVVSFDGEIRLDERYKYKIDVNLGDLVIIENTEWGIYKIQRVTGVIESYDSDGYIISLEFNS